MSKSHCTGIETSLKTIIQNRLLKGKKIKIINDYAFISSKLVPVHANELTVIDY